MKFRIVHRNFENSSTPKIKFNMPTRNYEIYLRIIKRKSIVEGR